MKSKKIIFYLPFSVLMMLLMCSCGGGGGGSSSSSGGGGGGGSGGGGSGGGGGGGGGGGNPVVTVTAPVAHPDIVFTDEDTVLSFNAVTNDADVDVGDTLSVLSVTNGTKGLVTFTGNIITYTPNADANGVDAFAYTITDSTNLTSTATVTVNINPIDDTPAVAPVAFASGVFPVLVDGYFTYTNGGQLYTTTGLTATQAIGVAVFQNGSLSAGEGDVQVTNSNAVAVKKSSNVSQKMESLMANDSRYRVSKYLQMAKDIKENNKKNKSINKSVKTNRAADPLGTRETFYHSYGDTAGNKTFEKIYSGSKCLIYSEVEPSFNVAYVNSTRGKVIGDAFEVSNPYHSSGKSIFDVDVSLFGNPWGIDATGAKINGGGQDGEQQVLLLIFKDGTFSDDGLYGFFNPLDEEVKGTVQSGDISNGAEIVYLSTTYANDDIALFSTLAHEFQHLIDYNQKVLRDGTRPPEIVDDRFPDTASSLFNEGQSVLAEELNGFGLKIAGNLGNDFTFNVVNDYQSGLSINSDNFFSFNGGADYGKGYLFWRYFYDTYGEAALIVATHSNLIQPMNIETATGKNIHVILQEFLLALMQTDSLTPSQPTIKITTVDRAIEYFDTKGVTLGFLKPLDYVVGFANNLIISDLKYVVRLYKLTPTTTDLSFTLSSIKKNSNYSIFTAIINK